jgi:hypothetical protein
MWLKFKDMFGSNGKRVNEATWFKRDVSQNRSHDHFVAMSNKFKPTLTATAL